jgi:hypothetical protein
MASLEEELGNDVAVAGNRIRKSQIKIEGLSPNRWIKSIMLHCGSRVVTGKIVTTEDI